MVSCPHCATDDVAYQDGSPLETEVTKAYRFKVWICTFFCHACGQEFTVELDDDQRKVYL